MSMIPTTEEWSSQVLARVACLIAIDGQAELANKANSNATLTPSLEPVGDRFHLKLKMR